MKMVPVILWFQTKSSQREGKHQNRIVLGTAVHRKSWKANSSWNPGSSGHHERRRNFHGCGLFTPWWTDERFYRRKFYVFQIQESSCQMSVPPPCVVSYSIKRAPQWSLSSKNWKEMVCPSSLQMSQVICLFQLSNCSFSNLNPKCVVESWGIILCHLSKHLCWCRCSVFWLLNKSLHHICWIIWNFCFFYNVVDADLELSERTFLLFQQSLKI